MKLIVGCLLVCTYGNFLALVSVAAHTVNKQDLGHEKSFENEVYKSESISRL